MPEYLKVLEIAEALRVSKMTVYRLVNTGELASVRIGRSFRVTRAAVDEYLRRNSREPATVDGGEPA